MEDGQKQLLEALTNSGPYREYQTAFTGATRLPLALRAPDSWQLPFRGLPGENPFCALLSKSSRACAVCLQMQQRLCLKAQRATASYVCLHGFAVTAAPVRAGDQLVGFLETGQVLRQPPDSGQIRRCLRWAARVGVHANQAALRRALQRSQVVPRRQYAAIETLVDIFARHLTLLASQMAARQQTAEPLVIRRAKEFIRERHAESFRLNSVARAVNISVFHFCKLFKKTTGRHFTDYVNEVRIEKSKNLLLNPDVEVSEIAYAVGFQSLTHFNRVFKALVGQPPSRYRRQLKGSNGQSPVAR